MANTRLVRLLRLIDLFETKRHVTVDKLVQFSNCSKRTIFRDLQLLNETGFDISFDKSKNGYYLKSRAIPWKELHDIGTN